MADLPRERASVAWRLALANHCVAAGAANEGQSRAPCRLGLRRRAERGRARGGRTLAFRCRVFILDWRFFGTAITIVGNDVRTALRREGGRAQRQRPLPAKSCSGRSGGAHPLTAGRATAACVAGIVTALSAPGGVKAPDGAQAAKRQSPASKRATMVARCLSAAQLKEETLTLRNAKCAGLLFASLGCPFI